MSSSRKVTMDPVAMSRPALRALAPPIPVVDTERMRLSASMALAMVSPVLSVQPSLMITRSQCG